MKKSSIHPELQMAKFWLLCFVAQDAIVVNKILSCVTLGEYLALTTPAKCLSVNLFYILLA